MKLREMNKWPTPEEVRQSCESVAEDLRESYVELAVRYRVLFHHFDKTEGEGWEPRVISSEGGSFASVYDLIESYWMFSEEGKPDEYQMVCVLKGATDSYALNGVCSDGGWADLVAITLKKDEGERLTMFNIKGPITHTEWWDPKGEICTAEYISLTDLERNLVNNACFVFDDSGEPVPFRHLNEYGGPEKYFAFPAYQDIKSMSRTLDCWFGQNGLPTDNEGLMKIIDTIPLVGMEGKK